MNFKNFFLLNEMLVVNPISSPEYVLAFDKWIYLFGKETNKKLFLDIIKKIPSIEDWDKYEDIQDNYDFLTVLKEEVPDVLVGYINGKNLNLLSIGSFTPDPRSSPLIQKVLKQLKLNSVSYTEDLESTETKVTKKKTTSTIPDIAYHGTSSIYLNSILSKGLMAGESDSNYAKQGIYHPDLVFFSTRIGEALHHSLATAQQKKGVPVILEFKIPDKDQIIADFDLEKLTGKDIYYGNVQGNSSRMSSYQKDPNKLSKHFGIYGYKKRIPSSFISAVWIPKDLNSVNPSLELVDFVKTSINKIKKMMDYGYF